MRRLSFVLSALAFAAVACTPTTQPVTTPPTSVVGVLIDSSDGPAVIGAQPVAVAALSMPPGRYLIEAKTNMAAPNRATCVLLVDGVQKDSARYVNPGATSTVFPSFVTVATSTSPIQAKLECSSESGGVTVEQTRLVASPAQ